MLCGTPNEAHARFREKPARGPHGALRLGMRQVRGMSESEAHAIAQAVRQQGGFDDIHELWRASGVRVATLRRLARADAFQSMGLDRQQALWRIMKLKDADAPLFDRLKRGSRDDDDDGHGLPDVAPLRRVTADYAALGLSLKQHPMAFLRPWLDGQRVTCAAELASESRHRHGSAITVAGLVLLRQRPATAKGVIFMTLEDETGSVNLIVQRDVYRRFRAICRDSKAMLVQGRVERRGQVVHVTVRTAHRLDARLANLATRPRDFR